ncbi:MAG: GFA family protein [Pseudomonadota bacterium]
MAEKTLTGGCACGAVAYAATGPFRPVIFCHCKSCRRQSGHIVAATAVAPGDLTVHGSENLTDWRATDNATRQFCAICGSVLFWRPDHGEHVSIMAGTLDQPTGLNASYHMRVSEKSDYYEITDGLPEHDLL